MAKLLSQEKSSGYVVVRDVHANINLGVICTAVIPETAEVRERFHN